MTVETNRYAHQFLASHEIKPHSRFHQWSDVTVIEIENASVQNTLLVGTDVVTGLLEGYSRKESHKGRKKSSGEMPQRITERHFLYKADDHPDYVLIEPCLKAAVRQNTGVGSMG